MTPTSRHARARRCRTLLCALLGAGLLALAGLYWASAPAPAVNPVLATGDRQTMLMDLSTPFSLARPPEGWLHRKFWTRTPMQLDFEQRDGRTGLVCRTKDSASMFGRFADIALDEYPRLAWTWRVDEPIRSPLDERLRQGDDHPIRLFLRFESGAGERRAMEIIWSNGAFREGQFKYIGAFPHYVATTGTTELGAWVDREIDLALLYRTIWLGDPAPRLKFIALFCDSDETNGRSEAALHRVLMRKR